LLHGLCKISRFSQGPPGTTMGQKPYKKAPFRHSA
jgi:hypothetical protein